MGGKVVVPDAAIERGDCPSCNAVLTDVPFEGPNCPHCGYDLEAQPEHFGAHDWHKYPKHHRESDQGPVRPYTR